MFTIRKYTRTKPVLVQRELDKSVSNLIDFMSRF